MKLIDFPTQEVAMTEKSSLKHQPTRTAKNITQINIIIYEIQNV